MRGRRYVGPIVDDGQRRLFAGQLHEQPRAGRQLAVVQLFFAKLNHAHARLDQRRDELFEISGRFSRVDQHAQPHVFEPLAARAFSVDRFFKCVEAVANPLNLFCKLGVGQLAVFFEAAERLLRPFQAGDADVPGVGPLVFADGRNQSADVPLCVTGRVPIVGGDHFGRVG